MEKREKKIATEMNNLLMQLTEMLWEHISISHTADANDSLNMMEHYLIEFLGKKSFASMSRLSSLFHVAPTTMTSIVDRMIRRGYLNRRRAQQDRRKVFVTLSVKGKEFFVQHHQKSLKIYTQYVTKLPDRGEQFYQNLNEINRNLQEIKKHFQEEIDD